MNKKPINDSAAQASRLLQVARATGRGKSASFAQSTGKATLNRLARKPTRVG
jgi:hypothetical protein